MLTAKDIMTKEVTTFLPSTEISEAARILLDKDINGAPVVDDSGKLVGIVCQSDLIAQQKKISIPSVFAILDGFVPLGSISKIEQEMRKIAALTAGEAMPPKPKVVHPDTPLDDIAAIMVDHRLHTLPVAEDGKLVGIIGKADVLSTLR
ncbi:MAG: CBS domain-containing protein [Desulfovibrio sp.]|uniref:CBS domain-containing protein n=1 Tax=Desulfovibrio sp. 7SRBS1 TaxID=3378064 RepID=UPI003B412B39